MNNKQKRAFLGISKFLKKCAVTLIGSAVIVAAVHGGLLEMAGVIGLALVTRIAAAVIGAVV